VSPRRSLKNLQRTLYALAVIPVVAGAATALAGSHSIPDAGRTTPSLESELRFYSVWWIGAGLYLGWLAGRVGERTRELRVFCGLLFLGGLSRVLAILDAGWPRPIFIVLMGLELSLPLILVVWQAKATAPPRLAGEGHRAPTGR